MSADQDAASAYTEVADPSRDALRLLAQPPFPPTDLSLLNQGIYPQGPPMEPAAPRTITDQELFRQLQLLLTPRGRRAVDEGLAAFRSRKIAAVVTDSNLRAALASLAGSPAEASIQAIRDGLFRQVSFGTPPNPSALAQVVVTSDLQLDVIFNMRYRYEDFRLLGAVLSHETLHSDRNVNANEELVSTTLQEGYHGRLLLQVPRLATNRTELSRRLNTTLMALLNTRDVHGRQRLTHDDGNVLPNSLVSLPSFGAAFLGTTPEGRTGTDPSTTPGNANLDFFLSAITRTRQTGADFNTATVEILDRRQAWATPEERIRLARLLKLRIPSPGKPHVSAQRRLSQGHLDAWGNAIDVQPVSAVMSHQAMPRG